MLTCQPTPECNGPWVMKKNWRCQTANGGWWSLSFRSGFHSHPSPSIPSAQSYLKMKRWSVEEIYPPPPPTSLCFFVWICHFTYHCLTSQYWQSEQGNGAIIPETFRGETVITDLSICCHPRAECDYASVWESGRLTGCWLTFVLMLTSYVSIFRGKIRAKTWYKIIYTKPFHLIICHKS